MCPESDTYLSIQRRVRRACTPPFEFGSASVLCGPSPEAGLISAKSAPGRRQSRHTTTGIHKDCSDQQRVLHPRMRRNMANRRTRPRRRDEIVRRSKDRIRVTGCPLPTPIHSLQAPLGRFALSVMDRRELVGVGGGRPEYLPTYLPTYSTSTGRRKSARLVTADERPRRTSWSCQTQGPLQVRAPEGERRSLESMVSGLKLPLWEGLRCAVMRCADIVKVWVRRYGMVCGFVGTLGNKSLSFTRRSCR